MKPIIALVALMAILVSACGVDRGGVANSYGGYSYKYCPTGFGDNTCHAYIFDENGDELCRVPLPGRPSINTENVNFPDLAPITCRAEEE